jgi:hypothetical protein
MARAIDLLSGHEPVQMRSYIRAPLTPAVVLALDPTEYSPSSVHEELTQIAMPACAEPEQMQLATRRMLAW